MKIDRDFWESRYKNEALGWDMGQVSPPLKAYFDQLTDRSLRILIPGAGNAYEAEYLFNCGFSDLTVVDIASQPLENLKRRLPAFPSNRLLRMDFFDLDQKFDLIVEQTFFCALHPSLRAAYVKKMHQLLEAKGKLIGILFDFPLTSQGPPFGGAVDEYTSLFEEAFQINKMARAYNSIPPRQGKELFVNFEKKSIHG